MFKKEFFETYILSRTSHKKNIEELLAEALTAWNSIKDY